jgi:zinc/manganese transport system substrate-binding protein
MKNLYLKMVLLSVLWIMSSQVYAALNVFACEPEWGALAKEIGKENVNVYVATTALQDPHRVEARPSLIAQTRKANVMICSGAELEVGWIPLLLIQSGNAQIQFGRPGFIEASSFVNRIEIPKTLDRSQGDVHPQGNPHVHLNPHNISVIARALAERFTQIDAINAAVYKNNEIEFQNRWNEAIARWEKQAVPLKGMPIVVYHRDLSYLIDWLGIKEVGSLEPKPGIPPTTGHLSKLLTQLEGQPAKAIVYSSYNDSDAAKWLSEKAKIPAIDLPYTVGGNSKASDLFGLFDDMVTRLLTAK